MSTYFPSGDTLADNRKWYVVDAAGQTVGRLATEVARVLTGKNKPQYTPFLDTGDHVIVINAKQAVFKGSKNDQKMYHHHTLYPGGLRSISVKDQFARHLGRQAPDGLARRVHHVPLAILSESVPAREVC